MLPSYEFAGPGEHVYPETRDAGGVPVGTVKPGERREFGQAPDDLWVPADGGDGDPPAGGEDPDTEDEAGTAEGAAPVPPPAPPAVITQ